MKGKNTKGRRERDTVRGKGMDGERRENKAREAKKARCSREVKTRNMYSLKSQMHAKGRRRSVCEKRKQKPVIQSVEKRCMTASYWRRKPSKKSRAFKKRMLQSKRKGKNPTSMG